MMKCVVQIQVSFSWYNNNPNVCQGCERRRCEVKESMRWNATNSFTFFHLRLAWVISKWWISFYFPSFMPSFPMNQPFFGFLSALLCTTNKNKSHFKLLFHIFVWQIVISFWRITKNKTKQQQIAISIRITSKLFSLYSVFAAKEVRYVMSCWICILYWEKEQDGCQNSKRKRFLFVTCECRCHVLSCINIFFCSESMYNKHFTHRSMAWVKGKWIQINEARTT